MQAHVDRIGASVGGVIVVGLLRDPQIHSRCGCQAGSPGDILPIIPPVGIVHRETGRPLPPGYFAW